MHDVRGAWGSGWTARACTVRAALCMLLLSTGLSQAAPTAGGAVIPIPASITLASGHYTIDADTPLRIGPGSPDAAAAARYFAGLVKRSRGWSLPVHRGGPQRSAVRFEHCEGLAAEAYRLEVAPDGVRVCATTAAGLFYGAVTLWELLPDGPGAAAVQAQLIEDQPVYPWRGLMLDSARHFQSPAFIKSML
ncbi:MAG: beta-N-acetylhexosaminidase, partial [Steroidobacteraceae bacterium]